MDAPPSTSKSRALAVPPALFACVFLQGFPQGWVRRLQGIRRHRLFTWLTRWCDLCRGKQQLAGVPRSASAIFAAQAKPKLPTNMLKDAAKASSGDAKGTYDMRIVLYQ